MTDPDWTDLRAATIAALDGTGPALVPAGLPGVNAAHEVPDEVALLLPTSGTTGAPKLVELSADALLFSARATRALIGGRGTWLLTLPLTHIAGWQVLIRSVVGDTELAVMDLTEGFQARNFEHALRRSGASCVSLVPTQLHRALAAASARAALARLDAVLVGGARLDPSDAGQAADAGIHVIATYGMTETSGGCIYDGAPMPGGGMRIDADDRIWLRGPMLARGYHADPQLTRRSFSVDRGVRWLRTSDQGYLDRAGQLRVTGRLDNVLISGGEKVHPNRVEAILCSLPGISEALVVGIPDPDWGHHIVALVQSNASTPPAPAAVRTALGGAFGRAAIPRSVFVVKALPRTTLGKLDRRAGVSVAEELLRNRN